MAEFIHDEDDEIDSSMDAAGFTDWAEEENETDITSTNLSQQQQKQQQQKQQQQEIEQESLNYTKSTVHNREQLVEVFISVFEDTQYGSVEKLVENDKVKYEFDWKKLMVKIIYIMNLYMNIYMYIYIYMYTYAHTYICLYIHMLIHTYTHTYIC